MKIELSFTRTQDDNHSENNHSPTYAANPPIGIHSALLQSIYLRLDISQCLIQSSTLKRKRDRESEHEFQDRNNFENNELALMDIESQTLGLKAYKQADVTSNPGVEAKLDETARRHSRTVSFKEILRLTDRSLRGMIFRPKQTTTGNLWYLNISGPMLGELSPVVFSPGYHEVILVPILT